MSLFGRVQYQRFYCVCKNVSIYIVSLFIVIICVYLCAPPPPNIYLCAPLPQYLFMCPPPPNIYLCAPLPPIFIYVPPSPQYLSMCPPLPNIYLCALPPPPIFLMAADDSNVAMIAWPVLDECSWSGPTHLSSMITYFIIQSNSVSKYLGYWVLLVNKYLGYWVLLDSKYLG